jgi:hypothetical protein
MPAVVETTTAMGRTLDKITLFIDDTRQQRDWFGTRPTMNKIG